MELSNVHKFRSVTRTKGKNYTRWGERLSGAGDSGLCLFTYLLTGMMSKGSLN